MTESKFQTVGIDSVTAANAIRYSAEQRGINANMTQINKLLYIAYGSLLVFEKKRLTKEHPCAWPYGPVFPSVHRMVKLSDDITQSAYNSLKAEYPHGAALIDGVVNKFGRCTAARLSAWSHSENSPWDLAVKSSNGVWNTRLDDEQIYDYFYSYLKLA